MRKGITCFGMPVTVERATDVLRPCGCRSPSRLMGSDGARPAHRRPAVAGATDPALPTGHRAPAAAAAAAHLQREAELADHPRPAGPARAHLRQAGHEGARPHGRTGPGARAGDPVV